jgi:hypothetical protein
VIVRIITYERSTLMTCEKYSNAASEAYDWIVDALAGTLAGFAIWFH